MTVAQFIKMASVLSSLIPVIIELVTALDAVANQEGTGKDKMALVLELVRNAFADLTALDIPWEKIEPYARKLVDGILKLARR